MLVIIPENGRILNREELEMLSPLIKKILTCDFEIDNRLIFHENIREILDELNKKIKERAIVRESCGENLPEINHRVFNFEIIDHKSIEVRITEINEKCNYKNLLAYLNSIY